jgi:aspartate 1-decarboxylase
MNAVGLIEFEKVEIFDIQNGNRFETYVIKGEKGSGIIGVNGAAARLVHLNDEIIIVNYVYLNVEQISKHNPQIIILENNNKSFIREK